MNEEIIIINGKEIDLHQVKSLIAENRKLEAIKFLMDHANIGLSEAKNFVDDLIESKEPLNADDEILRDIKILLKKNQKIEAVKLAKSSTGMGLKESKDFVESMDDMTLEELITAFKGKSVSSFSSNFKILNNEGELKDIHSFETTWNPNEKEEKKSNFDDRTSGNKTKTIILILAAIAAVIFYYFNR